ncbi:leucine-rich repeat domain-containing protein [Listeria innocua]|uniref:leucine-rich repeat domain-containing protein n=1 Tax=Listeria innocua TaxID=1642 RepID=UPI0013664F14|nr:leucine-rich repeat domain-containing protein [Listeria innocua]MWW18384.1 LPXTG cell wall anchor domain-containing protein [Listeria monocytogenes]EAF5666480.1 LPXTG cell wall anchor domain-containing protein [Listeria innocua]EAG9436302.1 LPXTG cell wall anchor domain-containing protein [Listeria innocua]EIX3330855.1 leucine-rich repeat domain-containing protein [Listeria innocua]EIX6955988.1 leucine-rich repeat domain-containing protein [Listeria innocua]
MINKQHFFKVAYAIMGVLLIGSIFIWMGSNNDVNAAEQSITEPTPINEIFPDANLAEVMKGFLRKTDVTDSVTQEDLNKVTILGGPNIGIESIEGIQYLPNLTTIYLYNNKITDISLLANSTKLEILNLTGNQIKDFSAIANLTKLHTLELTDTGLSDIGFISNLTELKELFISQNRLTDISPLANLTKVDRLYINENQITDITPLKNMKDLTFLQAWNNEVDDLTGIKDLTNLQLISFSQNKVTDLSPLANLTNLKIASLYENEIIDISPLANLTNLNSLNLTDNQIINVEGLANLTNLKDLYLGGNQITDIKPLSNLAKLEHLSLNRNQISDITPLANLTQLINLWMAQNNITDISPLKGLVNLKALLVSGQQITHEPELFKTNFTLTNKIKDLDGGLVEITDISHNGTYDNPIVTWELPRYVNEISYKYTQHVKLGNATTDHDVTVTQPLILPSHTVNFIVDDVLKTSLEVKEEALITQPAAPKKAGYTFTGWYDAKTGGNKWDFETAEMPRNDMTLYAQFSENEVIPVDEDVELIVEASGPVQESNDEVTVTEPTKNTVTLPKTGDSNNMLFVVLGLLLFGTVVVIRKKRR